MRTAVYALCLASLLILDLNASASQGKEIYSRTCAQCHLYGKAMASTKSAKEWAALISIGEGPDTLAQQHLDTDKAKNSWSYFKSETYLKESRDLKDYLQKYSSDRGRHNSCN